MDSPVASVGEKQVVSRDSDNGVSSPEKQVSTTTSVLVADNGTNGNHDDAASTISVGGRTKKVPMKVKLVSVVLVSLIGFGAHWSSGITGAMKSALKKGMGINNTQYALLDATDNFIKSVLILATGLYTDRLGGASTLVWGNLLFTAGSVLVAAATTTRNFQFMLGAMVIQSLGDVATQVAQYKVFASWFAPSDGFASTLGFELGLGKIGSFVGQISANVIAERLGDFSWTFWMSVVMNVFTNLATVVFYLFTRWCARHYSSTGKTDPATGEVLTERTRRLAWSKVVRLPWPFWGVIAFTLCQTTAASVFGTNATELAEQRFHVSSIRAGFYAALTQYMGFFLVPLLGLFIDVYGHRLNVMCVCGTGMFLSMSLILWSSSMAGTAAGFGFYAFAVSLGPTVIIDAIRTSLWYQEVFGSAYAVKICVNNAMNIIMRIVTGVIQDHDNDTYNHVVIVYAALAAGAVVVGLSLVALALPWASPGSLGRLQWTRKQRFARGAAINAQREAFETNSRAGANRQLSLALFGALSLLTVGAWVCYFWGVATGHND
ncbi:MFS transporter [Sporothrix schenckii 1099-18]|uniref:Lysosomal dipeptide transporter MFSD1 n=1 Tax=Sporothrix schenckii 1099-18 TaxID=1397361 RepID=A0A0F2MBP9_SPOSC|nr:MFS transporter [Sporothrix schenckii 1099-18]KJR86265.1 MFS transporter [Sporothrix schenckii 1099-18]